MSTGRALGSRYQLQTRLGGGAMGEVWRTLDRTTGTEVAAKLLRGEYTRDPAIVGRFVQERAILLTLDHPHVVRVRDLVVEGDDLAIVMDLVEGSDLRARLQEEGTLVPQEAARVAGAVLEALAYAHAQSCLHRDVKPDNVLLGGGRVLLTDFGIARLAQETNLRATGALGTPEYMAPEVFTTETVSPAADVYGAGCLLYELLSGRTPFSGGTNGYAVVNRHVTVRPPALQGVPDALSSLLMAMLDKDPARRPSAESAARTLKGLDLAGLDRLPVQAPPADWESLTEAAPALDPLATTVRGVAAPEAVLPTTDGQLPAAAPDLELGATTISAPRAPHQAPVLAPEVAPPAAAGKRSGLLVAGGVVLALAGIGAAALLLTSGGGKDEPEGTGSGAEAEVTAQVPEQSWPTGLSTARSAALVDGAVRVTVTWTSGRSAVQGPFYESVPVSSDDCQVAWESTAPATRSTVIGITGPCGFSVAVGSLPAGRSVTASYTVAAKADDAEALRVLLGTAAERTAAELTGRAQVADYAAQRLDRVVLDVPTAVVAGSPVPVRLLPVWLGVATPDARNVLFDSTAVGGASSLLEQVAGGLRGLTLSTSSCAGALSVERRLYPVTSQPDNDCRLVARVGDLPDAESDGFDITYRSG